MAFKKPTRTQAKARIALIGPSGSGKSMTGLAIGQCLAGKKRLAAVDTEHRSLAKYIGFQRHQDEPALDFDVEDEWPDYHPKRYIDAIVNAAREGYGAILIDSLTHAWSGVGGVLELVDREAARSKSTNSFAAWKNVTPIQQKLIETILSAPIHVIVTMRTKTEYVIEKDDRGKSVPRKIGLQPQQRDGLEYEFDIVADMDMENNLIIGKTRCPTLAGGVFPRPGYDLGRMICAWLDDGEPAPIAPPPAAHETRHEQGSDDGYTAEPPPPRQQQHRQAAPPPPPPSEDDIPFGGDDLPRDGHDDFDGGDRPSNTTRPDQGSAKGFTIPMGRTAGTPLADATSEDIRYIIGRKLADQSPQFARSNQEWITAGRAELSRRGEGDSRGSQQGPPVHNRRPATQPASPPPKPAPPPRRPSSV